jgi:uncharacterized OsmC-like protein/fermentation-respiration switch protein FrsA (DUF1100 family)
MDAGHSDAESRHSDPNQARVREIDMTATAFDFKSSAGYRLAGRLELPATPVRGWALFAHCFTCGKDNLAAARIARALAGKGIGTLRFDFAGLGKSGGTFGVEGFGADVADLAAAGRAMAAREMPPALLIGHSLGGAAALAAAGELPMVRAVVTIGAPFDVQHVLRQFDPDALAAIQANGEADVRLAGRQFRVRNSFIEDLRRHDQGARIAALRRPLLVMHAPQDEIVGIDNASQIFLAARHPKSFISLDGADHLLTKEGDARYVTDVVAGWASRYLPQASVTREVEHGGDVIAEETGAGKFQVAIMAGGVSFLADEPESVGGLGSGPGPFDLLSAGLAACTTMTLRLYADQKGWHVTRIRTAVGHIKEPSAALPDLFTRRIAVAGELDEGQRARLLEIAGRCPVHRTLESGARINTHMTDAMDTPNDVNADAGSETQLG